MNAVPAIETCHDLFSLLQSPYHSWQPHELLNYFQSRTHVHYFAVADDNEVIRAKIDAILINDFEFNGEAHHFVNKVDWLTNPSSDVEWVIMLHKFYYAVGLGLAYEETHEAGYVNKWMQLTLDWIATVPVDHLPADVTGRRVQNWIFAHYYFVSVCKAEAVTPEFYLAFLHSIHAQVTHLCHNLTPARNHRTLELYTIFLAAVVFPELKDAPHWLSFSRAELVKNICSDILPDGVHCELSTDYHHIVLRNFLAVKRLAAMNNISLAEEFDARLQKALEFSIYAHKPDGAIPSLSDGDTGSFLELLNQGYGFYGNENCRYAATFGRQGTPPLLRYKGFEHGGYYVMRSGWGESATPYRDERYLIFDCGPIGAGNHGHLDLLSFEMAAYGRSLVVDPGRYTYDESGDINWRVIFRSTWFHNTVTVDGLNQARYKFSKTKFKITGEHPEFRLESFASNAELAYLHGMAISHEYPVIHERKILFVNGEYWLICDRLSAEQQHRYDVFFHLSEIAQHRVDIIQNSNGIAVSSPHLLICQPAADGTLARIEPGYVSQTYGVKHAAPIVNFNREDSSCCFYTVLYPYRDHKPELSVSLAAVSTGTAIAPSMTAAAIEVGIKTDEQHTTDRVFIAHQPGVYHAWQGTFSAAVHVERWIENQHSFSSQINLSSSSTTQ